MDISKDCFINSFCILKAYHIFSVDSKRKIIHSKYMAKKKEATTSSQMNLMQYKKHLLPSVAGGGVAYVLSGVAVLGLAVFAAVWASNAINHHLHKK